MNLELRKFDMNQIQFPKGKIESNGPIVMIVGKRDTGKTHLVRDLLHHQRDIPVGVVISGSEAGNQLYSELVPKLFIHKEFNTVLIENILKRQHQVIRQAKQDMNEYGCTGIDGRAFVILDDMMFDKNFTKDKHMNYVFLNGRHLQLMTITAMQYVMSIPPAWRVNTDYVFIMYENIIANRKRLYDQFGGMFPTFKSFCDVMDQYTGNNDHSCLVIRNYAPGNTPLALEDMVFWYKADEQLPAATTV